MHKLKKLLREYQGLIIPAGVLMLCGFGIVLGVVPLARKAMTMNTEIKTVSKEVDALTNKVSVLQTIDEDAMRRDLQTLLSAVPSDKSPSTLLATLDGLASQTGVSIGSVSLTNLGSLATDSAKQLTEEERALGSHLLPLTINISGTYAQVQAFLTASTSVRRLFRIRTFDISLGNTTTGGSTNMLTANIAMDAFYYAIPSSIGTIGQPIVPLTSADTDLIAKVESMQLVAQTSAGLPPPSGGAGKSDPFSL